MEAGRLRHLMTIQTATESRGTSGSVGEPWSDTATMRAAIEPLRGREFIESLQVKGEVTHRIRMRYWPTGLTRKHRLTFDGRTFNIVSVLDMDERTREIEVMCKEVV